MLVPRPATYTPRPEGFRLTPQTGVFAPGVPEIAELLRELLGPATGLPLADAPAGGTGTLTFSLDPAFETLGAEGYRLSSGPDGVSASAGTRAGLRWAVQALRQLLPPQVYAGAPVSDVEWVVAGAEIVDQPRYPWRGAMLDVARWYKPVEWLYTFVDLAAMHRLNVVHLHLTEDQGWRFEVKRYPRLTEVGAWRRESPVGHQHHGLGGDGSPHGGFYTQAQLRDLVAYAARRGVTIVPEIDLPGHTQAAIAAYPELGNDPANPPEVWTEFGVSERVLNTDDATVEFMRNVLTELVEVFPSEYIHLGGDEVPTAEWAASPAARARMAEQGSTDPEALLGWWISQLADHLKGLGRRPVLWDELVELGAPEGSTIMAWRGRDRVLAALRAGHDVVATPQTDMYLDYPQVAGPGEPLSIADGDNMHIGVTSLSQVYAYDPEPAEPVASGARVIGAQGNLWSEYLPTPERAEYALLPRLAAVAEVAWGSERDEADLRARLTEHLRRLDAAGVGYRPLDALT